MSDYQANKIKFALDQKTTLTIASWEQTEFNGNPGMKYTTSDGKFFDASKGLIKLLQALPVTMGQTITIEKRSHPDMAYGCFYVNDRNIDDIQSGVPAPVVPTPAPAPLNDIVSDPSNTLVARVVELESQVQKLKESQLF